MAPPRIVIKDCMGGRRLARSFSWSVTIERLVDAAFVVIIPELFQLSFQVDCVPDEQVVKKLPSDRPDQPLYEWMRHRYIRCRLDLVDFEYAQVGLPSVEAK